jgi:hypothetical protein
MSAVMTEDRQTLRREYTNALRRCTPKQRQWLRAVAANAGQKWGRTCEDLGFSTNTIWKWLRQEQIQRVLAMQGELAELDSDLTRERIQREYSRLAFSSFKQFHAPDGSFKPAGEWTEDMFAAVESMEFDAAGKVVKIKLHRKPTALDSVARIRGLLESDRPPPVQVNVVSQGPAAVNIMTTNDPIAASLEYERLMGLPAPSESLALPAPKKVQ